MANLVEYDTVDHQADAWSGDQYEHSPKELSFRQSELLEDVGRAAAAVPSPPDDEFDHILVEAICADDSEPISTASTSGDAGWGQLFAGCIGFG